MTSSPSYSNDPWHALRADLTMTLSVSSLFPAQEEVEMVGLVLLAGSSFFFVRDVEKLRQNICNLPNSTERVSFGSSALIVRVMGDDSIFYECAPFQWAHACREAEASVRIVHEFTYVPGYTRYVVDVLRDFLALVVRFSDDVVPRHRNAITVIEGAMLTFFAEHPTTQSRHNSSICHFSRSPPDDVHLLVSDLLRKARLTESEKEECPSSETPEFVSSRLSRSATTTDGHFDICIHTREDEDYGPVNFSEVDNFFYGTYSKIFNVAHFPVRGSDPRLWRSVLTISDDLGSALGTISTVSSSKMHCCRILYYPFKGCYTKRRFSREIRSLDFDLKSISELYEEWFSSSRRDPMSDRRDHR